MANTSGDLFIKSKHIVVFGNYPAVSGSKYVERDLDRMAAKLDVTGNVEFWREIRRFQPAPVDPLNKWCSVCGCMRPKSYFSPKADTWDKLDHRCKECENKRKREAYALKVGRPVRGYRHQETEQNKVAVA